MTRDPIAIRIMQPAVDRLGIEPRNHAERFADLFMLAVLTGAAVNVATITFRPVVLPEILHIAGAIAMRYICRSAAAQGPVYLEVQPYGMVHLVLRITMFQTLLYAVMNVSIAIHSGMAGLVPISMFRWMLSGTEAVIGLLALYLSICRRPPPRRRTGTVPVRA